MTGWERLVERARSVGLFHSFFSSLSPTESGGGNSSFSGSSLPRSFVNQKSMEKFFIKSSLLFLFFHTWPIGALGQKHDYFPIHIGDKWVYEHRSGGNHWANKVVEVTDTTIINGKQYFVFEDRLQDIHYEPGKIYYTSHYYRKATNDDVMKFSGLINKEQLYYTFQRDSLYKKYLFCGEFDLIHKWQITFLDTNRTYLAPRGLLWNCYQYSFDDLLDDHTIFSLERILAPSIGFVYEAGEGDVNFLVGAFIDGLLIGDTTVTSIKEIPQELTSSLSILYQNFLNPFHSSTQIRFYLPHEGTASVRVYDVSGRMIKEVSHGFHAAGEHVIMWEGRDQLGRAVASGTYFSEIRFEDERKVAKMMLVR